MIMGFIIRVLLPAPLHARIIMRSAFLPRGFLIDTGP